MSFQWSFSQKVRAEVICAGLLDPTPKITELSQRQKLLAKVYFYKTFLLFSKNQAELPILDSQYLHLFQCPLSIHRCNEQPADDLSKVAAMDIDSLFSKTSKISKGVIYNIHHSLLKEWGPESLGVLPDGTIQQLLTGVIFLLFLISSFFSHMFFCLSYCLVHFSHYGTNFSSCFFKGLNLLELASHLEEKPAQLCHEGLGRIKMALAGTDTSSLLEILEGSSGHVDLNTSTLSASTETPVKKSTTSEKTSEDPKKTSITPSDDGGLASAELVFPLKSIPLIIAGLPQSFLLLCGPETLSSYRCQYPSCTL